MSNALETLTQKADRAREAADKTAHELAEATAARDERVTEALRDLAQWRLDTHTNELHDARGKASAAWESARAEAIANGDGWSLESLLAAFAAHRVANAQWVEAARSAAGYADHTLGMARNGIGVDIPRRGPVQDSTAEMSFAAELDRIVVARVAVAVAAEVAGMDAHIHKAITDAEDGK